MPPGWPSEVSTLTKEALASTTSGNSGADRIGATPQTGLTLSNGQPATTAMQQLVALFERVGALGAVVPATETTQGLVELASVAEARAGTLAGAYALTPATAKAMDSEGFFSSYQAAAQPDIPDGTNTKVIFDVEEVDVSGWFVPGSGTTGSRYTPQRAGWYELNGAVRLSGPAVDASRVSLSVFKNGTQYKVIDLSHTSGTTNQVIGVSGSCYVQANGSDFFELYLLHTYGVARAVTPGQEYVWFQGRLVVRT
jgi:hypothetical protein